MDILQLIKIRRTIRKYRDTPISAAIVNTIIEAGTYAPSAHNSQPWRFTIITKDNAGKKFVIKLRDYPQHHFLPSINAAIRHTIEMMKSAPVIIAVYNNCRFSHNSQKIGQIYGELAHLSEIESISAAIQNMHLIATSLGVGMAWLTMPLLIKKYINRMLNISYELVAMLTLGYPAEKREQPVRKGISEIVERI